MKNRMSYPPVMCWVLLLSAIVAFPANTYAQNRVVAEWEPALGTLISWPLLIPHNLVVELARDDMVFVLVENEARKTQATNAFNSWGIDLEKIQFIIAEQGDNANYTRDWGPFATFDMDGYYSLSDPQFIGYPITRNACDARIFPDNGDYAADDAATQIIADALGFYNTQLPAAMTGGNVMFDGHGTAFSTCVILNENFHWLGIQPDEFFSIANEHLGIDTYNIIPNFEDMGIQHIDCLLKLLDEETLLVAQATENHPDYIRLESIVYQLSMLKNVYGRPYKILRIKTPTFLLNLRAAYTNSLILNKRIFVPMFGIPGDVEALDTWRQAMPGYEVIGFEADPDTYGWMSFDALHCRTRAIWDPEMLYITHRRINEIVKIRKLYPIKVHIRDYSQTGLIMSELRLSWRLAGDDEWKKRRLFPTFKSGLFVSAIPGADAGQTVEYFISAADNSGRYESLPKTAPEGYYSFTIQK